MVYIARTSAKLNVELDENIWLWSSEEEWQTFNWDRDDDKHIAKIFFMRAAQTRCAGERFKLQQMLEGHVQRQQTFDILKFAPVQMRNFSDSILCTRRMHRISFRIICLNHIYSGYIFLWPTFDGESKLFFCCCRKIFLFSLLIKVFNAIQSDSKRNEKSSGMRTRDAFFCWRNEMRTTDESAKIQYKQMDKRTEIARERKGQIDIEWLRRRRKRNGIIQA